MVSKRTELNLNSPIKTVKFLYVWFQGNKHKFSSRCLKIFLPPTLLFRAVNLTLHYQIIVATFIFYFITDKSLLFLCYQLCVIVIRISRL